MKIDKSAGVKPPKFSDQALSGTFGAVIGHMSEDHVHAIAFRYAEVQVARLLQERWLDQVNVIANSSAPNHDLIKLLSTGSTWDSVADEALDYLRADQEQLNNEELLAHAHIALCDKVIAALTDGFVDPSPTSAYRVGHARDGSPLQHLQISVAALNKTYKRTAAARDARNLAMRRFGTEAKVRQEFGDTSDSVTLDELDESSADSFEEWTAWLLERDGCEIVRRHGGPNDQGADVIAITLEGLRVVLQCKHSTKLRNRVDPRYVHELNGTARQEHGADIVAIVTNRALSDAAERFAVKHRIHVVDRPVLRRWATYGIGWLPSGTDVTAAAVATIARTPLGSSS